MLARAAELQNDDALSAAWHLRSSVLAWRTSQRSVALEQARKAYARMPSAAAPWLTWLVRALGDETAAREVSTQLSLDEDRGSLAALEHVAARFPKDRAARDELERRLGRYERDLVSWLRTKKADLLKAIVDKKDIGKDGIEDKVKAALEEFTSTFA